MNIFVRFTLSLSVYVFDESLPSTIICCPFSKYLQINSAVLPQASHRKKFEFLSPLTARFSSTAKKNQQQLCLILYALVQGSLLVCPVTLLCLTYYIFLSLSNAIYIRLWSNIELIFVSIVFNIFRRNFFI